jgi:hypothetical protein
MKTLTELSGITMRKAAAAMAEAKRQFPRAEAPVAEVVAAPPTPPDAEPAVVEGEVVAAAVEGEAAPATPVVVASPVPPAGRPAEEVESEAVKAAFDAAVAAATGLSGDRLARLRDAVKVVGRQIEDVRLVRVFGTEESIPGAKTVNGFQYVVDVAPASMRQTPSPQKKERGRGGPGGGGGGGRGGGGGGKGAPTSGGFSMDSLRDDRKGQKSGSGGGRGRPGGGQPR